MLTVKDIREAKPQERLYRLADSHGLCLEINPNGSRLWRYRYRFQGKATMLALGEFPAISLADARQKRDAAKAILQQGINPAEQRRQQKQQHALDHTFKAIAQERLDKTTHLTPNYQKQTRRILEQDVYPHIGSLHIKTITPADILATIRKAEERGSIQIAHRIRTICSSVFKYAIANLYCENDPTIALHGAIQNKPTEHAKAIPKEDLQKLMNKLNNYGGEPTTIIATQLLMLTFVRTGELISAKWDEIDLDNALWRIPAERMKMKTDHVVPLSHQAINLLKQLHSLTGDQSLLFPGRKSPNEPIGRTTIYGCMKLIGMADYSPHDFRATAATYLYEMGYRSELVEKQLAHEERNKVRASYNHAEYLEERRQMMQRYSDYLDSIQNDRNVVPFRSKTA